MMSISLFHGELLCSYAIRHARLGLSGSVEDAESTYLIRLPKRMRSCRLPFPKTAGDADGGSGIGVAELRESTAWPILSLLYGFDLSDLINRPGQSNGLGERTLHGLHLKMLQEENLRFCAECAQAQRQHYAVSWWMRDLNLPLVAVCPRHCTPLRFTKRVDVLAKSGLLPHEVLQSSEAVQCVVDRYSLNIACTIRELCHNSEQIDSCALRRWLSAPQRREVRSGIETMKQLLCDRLGLAKQVKSPAQRDNTMYAFDELTTATNQIDDLLCIAMANNTPSSVINDLKAWSRREETAHSATPGVALARILTGYRYAKHRNPRERLVRDCKLWLEQLDVVPPSTQAIAILLMHYLDREWITAWLNDHEGAPGFGARTVHPMQLVMGMHIVKRASDGLSYGLRPSSLWRCADIKRYLHDEAVVNPVGESFLAKCVRGTSGLLDETYRHSRPRRL